MIAMQTCMTAKVHHTLASDKSPASYLGFHAVVFVGLSVASMFVSSSFPRLLFLRASNKTIGFAGH